MGVIEDHIHLLTHLPPTKAISDIIRDIKANTSKWFNETFPSNQFEWQKGYGAFTVSYSQIDSVCHYIQNQREHHKKKSFEEEYTEFLKLHDITFNREYLFENEYLG